MDLPVISNVEAERGVIGGLLIAPSRWPDVEHLTPEHFAAPAHQAIWRAVLALRRRRMDLEAVALRQTLQRPEELEALRLAEETALSASSIVTHARLVVDRAIRRSLVTAGARLIDAAGDELLELDTIGEMAQAALARVREITDPAADVAVEAHVALGQAIRGMQDQAKHHTIPGVPFGLAKLDDQTDGMKLGEMTIAAGKTGRGKSALGWQVALANVLAGRGVLGFTLEMDAAVILRRLLAGSLRENAKALPYRLGAREADVLTFSTRLADGGWFGFYEQPEQTITQIRSRARAVKATHPELALVVVDYLQLVRPPPALRAQGREREVAAISQGLKALAKELGVAVLALSQFSRKADEEDRRPRLSDLRESGSLEHDAALVIMLHDPDPTAATRPEGRAYELLVPKHRHGPSGLVVDMVFHPDWLTFEEGTLPALETEEQPQAPTKRRRRRGGEQLALDNPTARSAPPDDDTPPPTDGDAPPGRQDGPP